MASYVGKVQIGARTPAFVGSTLYGICNAYANATTKTVLIADEQAVTHDNLSTRFINGDFQAPLQGTTVHVKFIYGNTVINNNSTTNPNLSLQIGLMPQAKPIIGNCVCASGAIISFTYDENERWVVNDANIDTTYTFYEGDTNGTFKVSVDGGTPTAVTIHGLGESAYKNTINNIANNSTSLDVPTTYAVYRYIQSQTGGAAGITGAMHFRGTATVQVTDGGTEDPVISNYDFKDENNTILALAGDVILYRGKEFIWTGTVWELLGNSDGGGTITGDYAAIDHTHGNLSNDGKIYNSKTISEGDTLVIVSGSQNNTLDQIIRPAELIFDGITTTKALTPRGTWEDFNNYVLPIASSSVLGGIKLGFTTVAADQNYAVEVHNGMAYVHVPWTNGEETVNQTGISSDEDNQEYNILLKHTANSNVDETAGVNFLDIIDKHITVNAKTGKLTVPGGIEGKTSEASHADIADSASAVEWTGIDNKPSLVNSIDGLSGALTLSDLGLANAMHFIGVVDDSPNDAYIPSETHPFPGNDEVLYIIGRTNYVPQAGDIILDPQEHREYVYVVGDSSYWELLGQDASRTLDSNSITTMSEFQEDEQDAYVNTWITRITQDSDRIINVERAVLDTSGNWNGIAAKATQLKHEREIYVDLETIRNQNNPITFDGTANIAISIDGILPVSHGGTGAFLAPTRWGIIYADSTSSYASTTYGPEGQVLIGHGTNINDEDHSDYSPTWYNGLVLSGAGTNNSPYFAEFGGKIYIETALGIGKTPNAAEDALKINGNTTIYHDNTPVAHLNIHTTTIQVENNNTLDEYSLDLIPHTDTKGQIGTSNYRWNNGYFSDILNVGNDNTGISLDSIGLLTIETTEAQNNSSVSRFISLNTAADSQSDISIDGLIHLIATATSGIINLNNTIELAVTETNNSHTGSIKISTTVPTIILETTTYKNDRIPENGYQETWTMTNTAGNFTLTNGLSENSTYISGDDKGWDIYGMVGINTIAESRPNNNTTDPHSLVINGSILLKNDDGNAVHLDVVKETITIESNGETISTDYPYINIYPDTNLKGSLGLSADSGTAKRWGSLYLGTADTYGDEFTPVYWNNGVPEHISVVQKYEFTLTDESSSYTIHLGNTYKNNTIVTQIVVEEGFSYMREPLVWNIVNGNIVISTESTVAPDGTVSGYIITSTGSEIQTLDNE